MIRFFLIFGLIATSLPAQTKRLEREYSDSNRDYFNNELPKDTEIKLVRGLKNDNGDSSMATTFCIHADGRLHCTIQINPDNNRPNRVLSMTLLHEECHIKLWQKVTAVNAHGSLFQSCMKELAYQNAFEDLW